MILRALLTAALCLVFSCALAADDSAAARAYAAQAVEKEQRINETAIPDSPSQTVLDDENTREKYLETMRGYYDYRSSGFEYRARVFEWQLFSSRVIFVVVVLLVLCGIYFAAVQFHVALRAVGKPAAVMSAAPTPTESPILNTHLEISAKGVVVNSSILGVIILVLSLAFFYLYLVYVYPIKDTI